MDAISDVRIGRYEDYVVTRMSDHLPLSIDVDFD
jgi:hypothetical protein